MAGWTTASRRLRLATIVALSTMGGFESVAAADRTVDGKGFDRTRPTSSQFPFEHIDPLNGNLILTFTDIELPGNAGFNLRVQRTYNSKIYRDIALGREIEDSWAGFGWSLHMGRIVNPE